MSQDVHDAGGQMADAKTKIADLYLKLSDVGETLTKLYAQRRNAGADQVRDQEIARLEKKEIIWEEQKLEYLKILNRCEAIQHQQHGT
jgi:hypothetical protein